MPTIVLGVEANRSSVIGSQLPKGRARGRNESCQPVLANQCQSLHSSTSSGQMAAGYLFRCLVTAARCQPLFLVWCQPLFLASRPTAVQSLVGTCQSNEKGMGDSSLQRPSIRRCTYRILSRFFHEINSFPSASIVSASSIQYTPIRRQLDCIESQTRPGITVY